MRLISFNYSQQPETVISASSSHPNFPVSNIRHEHRSKEWRSAGHFTVTALTKSLEIEGDNPVSVNLTEGSYSTVGLKLELQTKLDAAAPGVYEVLYSEKTGIWTFKSDTAFTLKGTSSVLSIIGFNPVDRTGTLLPGAKPAIHTEEFVVFDLKTTEEIDSIVLLWGIKGYKLSGDAEIRVQASATANFSAPALDEVITFNDKFEVASKYLENPVSYRYWRVVIKDPANPNQYVNFGVLVLGLAEKMDPENGFTYGQTDNSNITRTDFGQEFADEYPITGNIAIDFAVMEYSQAEKIILMFQQLGNRKPIYAALDPEAEVFDKDCFSIYGKFSGSVSQKHSFYNIFDSGLAIREVN